MNTQEKIYRARMTVNREKLDTFMEMLAVMDIPPSSWEDVESGDAWIETFDADRESIEKRAREMADIVSDVDGSIHVAQITEIQGKDWTEEWKKFFHTTRISKRIVIHPAWEPYTPQIGDIVVDIDPGMSFGTGLHPTTRSCLQYLDLLSEMISNPAEVDIADLGCGSGILAIAAAKLGFGKISALDYDPMAVKVSRENIVLNGISEDRISLAVADVTKDTLPKGHIVIANILAPVLIQAAARISAALLPGPRNTLILSGVLISQSEEVVNAYAQFGLSVKDSHLDAEWRTSALLRENKVQKLNDLETIISN